MKQSKSQSQTLIADNISICKMTLKNSQNIQFV